MKTNSILITNVIKVSKRPSVSLKYERLDTWNVLLDLLFLNALILQFVDFVHKSFINPLRCFNRCTNRITSKMLLWIQLAGNF